MNSIELRGSPRSKCFERAALFPIAVDIDCSDKETNERDRE
jgi:hypothetical protein